MIEENSDFSNLLQKSMSFSEEKNDNPDSDITSIRTDLDIDVPSSDTLFDQDIPPEQTKLKFDHLQEIIYKLGLIKLCWPGSIQSLYGYEDFPESYKTNDEKEKVLLLYCENFRLQFCYKYPNRKPLFLACENECAIQKMVSTTIFPTTLPYPELVQCESCASFVADHLEFEPFEDTPTSLPKQLASPYTVFQRQSGHSFEIATALCSLLLGVGYDAYVVSGYAIKDVTLKIMVRIDSPFPSFEEQQEETKEEKIEGKYVLKAPRDLRSKFLLMMEQREIDKINAGKEKEKEEERLRILEEEKIPPDELEGQRVHAWILVLAGDRDVEKSFFIEPSTGIAYDLDSNFYCGIESLWNHQNYWVNKQDCVEGLGKIDFDLDNVENWEHLLVGEPLIRRKYKPKELEEEDTNDMYDEKHLDMPFSWSKKISIPHDELKLRYPNGSKATYYKRTCIQQFAPYVSYDGLLTRITRYDDFDCNETKCIEDIYGNRADFQVRQISDVKNGVITEYFKPGREDGVIKYIYYEAPEKSEDRLIFYNHKARFDALCKMETSADNLTQYYKNREDKLYFRQVIYSLNDNTTNNKYKSDRPRETIKKIIDKFDRDETKNANDDIAYREFAILDRKILIKYHYGDNNLTASTRTFIKPPISEMGEEMTFKPELTYGYQAEIGKKPPSNLKLYILFEKQLKEEEKVLNSIREIRDQIKDFIQLRSQEHVTCNLEISLYNREQNINFRTSMLEKEEEQRLNKVKEVNEEIDYLAAYLARLGDKPKLTYNEALDAKYSCLSDFKDLLLQRANRMQRDFDNLSEQLQTRKSWYRQNHENLSPEEEAIYFQQVNEDMFKIRTLEIRLTRHKELAPLRYEALVNYLDEHPSLQVLNT